MEPETRNQDHIAYNNFFYATMCHVCKRFGDDVPLTRCSGCKLISYCSPEHHQQHWEQHKSLCNAVQDVMPTCSMENRGSTFLERAQTKLTVVQLVETKLGRRLLGYEEQMFVYPKECVICNELDGQSLKDCRDCAASHCKDHINGTEHKDICGPLGLCYRLHVSHSSVSKKLEVRFCAHTAKSDTCQDMHEFIATYVDLTVHQEVSSDLLKLEYSQYLFRPLTLFHAMRILKYVPERQDLIIHVVNSTQLDVAHFTGWNMLIMLKLIEVTSLKIIMIGADIECRFHALLESEQQKKECSFEFHNMSYVSYVGSSSFVKPDLVVGFDSGVEMNTRVSSEETWIQLIAKQNCPFVLTSYTQKDLETEIEIINTILDRKVKYHYNGENPFASFRPYRAPSPKVVYSGRCLVVYKSLCT
ncbi:PREDICTED: uncharacterized protein LOC105560561 [Vollenhovia emeryi]|uniref:uncharacterized protein LOC105560561 n=1 Tax=Vollenhovia emeryi TaxID=411798 RepID=UPI0005F5423A|nr:PREDICTED: uncharacterized protein LOC105560561 [Vollenhovia emeryi]